MLPKNYLRSVPVMGLIMLLLGGFIHAAGITLPSNKSVTVTVKDTQGPVPGAAVMLKGTSKGNVTDADGKAVIENVSDDAVIVVTCLGYISQEINVGKRAEIIVNLEEDSQQLDDVVVIGYGTARKRDMTGAVSSIKADKIAESAPRSVSDMLRSAAAGLNIGTASDAKAEASISIRGDGTLSASSSPLIVLDGVIYEGSVADINPMDIASVDILKDASAAAVYGAKSANGVVAITTKRGKVGKPVVTFDAQLAVATSASQPALLSPKQFLKYRQDYNEGRNSEEYLQQFPQIFVNPHELTGGLSTLDWYNYDQKTPVSSVTEQELMTKWLSRLDFKSPEIDNYFAGKTTDWGDLVFRTAFQQNYTVGVSAATDRVSQYYSVNYTDREGIVVGDRYKNIRVRTNLETKITDFLTVGLNAQFASRDESGVPCAWTEMVNCTPYSLNNMDDLSSPYRKRPNGLDPINPFYESDYTDKRDIYQTLNANIFAKVELPFGIEYEFNYTPYLQWREYYIHHSSESETYAANNGESQRSNTKTWNWQIDNILRWKRSFADRHNVEVTLLANSEKGQQWYHLMKATGYSPNDKLGYHAVGFATIPTITSNDTYQTGDALMARLFYSYNDTYMLTASIRRDGYSAFGKENPHAYFPAVALGWVFTHENFMKEVQWLDYGKLRLSWGQNGNRDIGRYAALSTISSSLAPYIDSNGNVYTTTWMDVSTMSNYSLKWERSASLNLGLDFSIFGNVVSGSAEYYWSTTHDLLVNRALPNVTGFASVTANLGKLRNRGFELTLNANVINNHDWKWTLSGNMSMNRRKIIRLYGDMEDVLDDNGNVIGQKESDDVTNQWFIGQDPDRIWSYKRVGVWQLGEETEAAKYGCQPGDFKYKDQNGDGLMTNEDRVFQGYRTPRARISMRSDLSWKGFTLAATLYSYLKYYGSFNQAANNNGFPDRCSNYYFPRWTKTNPINDYARIGSKNIGTNWVDKSFVRLDNVTLSYNVPSRITKKFAVQALRVTANVQNAAVWSPHWDFWDPEVGSYTPRTFTLGVNVTL